MAIPGWVTKSLRAVWLVGATLGVFPLNAHAMTGPIVDTAADVLAIFVLIFVPIGGIYLFWMVHILPEKIAEKRHHPQKDAIQTLCILSLFFGGLLWPIAWLWAYSKPVIYKLAYGTDKHENYYKEKEYKEKEAAEKTAAAPPEELARIREQIEQLSKKMGGDATDLEELRQALRNELTRLDTRLAKPAPEDEKEPG